MKKLFKSSIVLFFLVLSSCTQKAEEKKVLRLSIWPNYISEDVIKSFEKDTGITVEVSNFSANEELYAKLKAGGNVYDLVVPSDYMIEIMAEEGLLEELGSGFNAAKENVDPNFLGRDFDKENKYSLPYAWTATGIAFNKDMVKEKVESWKALLTSKTLAGKLALLDDGREVIAAALRADGKSINTTSDDDLKDAKKLLMGVRSRVKLFTSEPYLALSNKEIGVAQIYSSDALQLKREGKLNVDFVLPEEGGPIAIDNFAVPKGAQGKELAQKFVSYVLTPAQYKVNFESQLFGPVVKNLSSLVSDDLKNNKVLFPQAEKVSKLEQMKDLGDKTGDFDRIWTEFKAQ
ncbi:MAG: spermidine/putrescine ABC transporter substrate-binding protein [Bdellovibrionota bacterium]